MPKTKTVELHVHWKQGDDFAGHLEASKGKVTLALSTWADELAASADQLRAIARKFEGWAATTPGRSERGVTAEGDTHTVTISGLTPELASKILEAPHKFATIAGRGADEEE